MKLSNVFIGRVSGENASSALSSLFIAQVVVGCLAYSTSEGLSVCTSILCSQAFGRKLHKLTGMYFYRILLLMILICLPIFSLFISVSPITYFITHDWELSQDAGSYTRIVCFGFPAYAGYKIAVRFLQAQNIVWGPLVYLIIGNITNGLLQYILIFHCSLGIPGAAVAYVISMYVIAMLVFAHIRFTQVHILTAVRFSTDLITEWSPIAKYAVPAIIQTFIAMVVTTVFPLILLLMVAHSKEQLAIYSILYSVWFVVALVTMGYSNALAIRISHLLGQNEISTAKRSAIFGIFFGGLVLLIMCILLMTISRPMSSLFTTDSNFAKELSHNFLIFPVTILADTMMYGQGVMNACGMPQTQALFKFIFLFMIGFVSEYFIVKLVTWKAICIYVIQAITCLLCFILCMAIVFSRNWEAFSNKIILSTLSTNNPIEIPDEPISQDSDLSSTIPRSVGLKCVCNSRGYIVLRYTVCLLSGCFIFTTAYLLNVYFV